MTMAVNSLSLSVYVYVPAAAKFFASLKLSQKLLNFVKNSPRRLKQKKMTLNKNTFRAGKKSQKSTQKQHCQIKYRIITVMCGKGERASADMAERE
jgi:hypothetical protein